MKTTLLTIATLLITFASFGQAPEAFKYQAVVRDAGGVILTNQSVGYQLSILQGSTSGTTVYVETFTPTTNGFGLVNLEIGSGTTSDDFTIIDWSNGPYFMETAVDISGGTTYAIMGTSQLLSVPYALYAKTSGSSTPGPQGAAGNDGSNGIDGNDGSAGANGTNGSDGNGVSSTVDNGDGTFTFNYTDGSSFTTSVLTGPQGVQGVAGNDGANGVNGNDGSAGANGTNGSDGNGVSSTVDNGDGTFTFNYTNGSSFTTSVLTGSQGIQGPAGNDGANGVDGNDGSAGANGTNGSDGNGISSTVDNGDGTFTFNYTDGGSFTTSVLTGPQGVQGLPGNDGTNGVDGNDGSDGVGIAQTVSQSGSTVTLSNGGGTFSIDDGDIDSNNEIQLLSMSGDTLFISGGNYVILPLSDFRMLTYPGASHTEGQCVAEGGIVFNTGSYTLCRFSGSASPSGWTQADDWQACNPGNTDDCGRDFSTNSTVFSDVNMNVAGKGSTVIGGASTGWLCSQSPTAWHHFDGTYITIYNVVAKSIGAYRFEIGCK